MNLSKLESSLLGGGLDLNVLGLMGDVRYRDGCWMGDEEDGGSWEDEERKEGSVGVVVDGDWGGDDEGFGRNGGRDGDEGFGRNGD